MERFFVAAVKFTAVQRLVRVCLTNFVVRGMVRWKSYIEHPIEKSFTIYVTNITDRDLVVERVDSTMQIRDIKLRAVRGKRWRVDLLAWWEGVSQIDTWGKVTDRIIAVTHYCNQKCWTLTHGWAAVGQSEDHLRWPWFMAHLVSVKRQLATQELSIIAVTSIIQKWMQQISPVERPELKLWDNESVLSSR